MSWQLSTWPLPAAPMPIDSADEPQVCSHGGFISKHLFEQLHVAHTKTDINAAGFGSLSLDCVGFCWLDFSFVTRQDYFNCGKAALAKSWIVGSIPILASRSVGQKPTLAFWFSGRNSQDGSGLLSVRFGRG